MKRPTLVGLAGLCLLALVFEALVALGAVSPLTLSRPSSMVLAIGDLVREESLIRAMLTTFGQTFAAILIASAVGMPLGFLLYRFRTFGVAYDSWLGALFAAPLILLYPLFLVIFGRTLQMVVFMGVLTGAIPIIIHVRQGLLEVQPIFLNVARAFNASAAFTFWRVMLPAAVPTVFTGVRLGLVYALVNIIGIEFLIDYGGLGRLVSEMYFRYDVPGMYATIVFIILISTTLFWLLARVQNRLRRL
ncbi:MAG: ABC transporter permease subunit [bacterium]